MILRKKKLLAAFLEKDNVKLLVYQGKARIFAGQITFAPEILRDAFIADGPKFSAQVKVAFAQKMPLREVTDVVLFMPPDKTFTKTMAAADSIDGFIQSLPYFKEELLISEQEVGPKDSLRITHTAFEKKLIEDFERPFLESGKKILAVRSTVNDLVAAWPMPGEYYLFIPLEKDIAFAVAADGGILEASDFKPDLFVTRFGEYIANHNLNNIRNAYTLGVFPKDLGEKLHHAQNLTIGDLASGDIYDQVVMSYLRLGKSGLNFSDLAAKIPRGRGTFLVGAALVGMILVVLVAKSVGQIKMPETKKTNVLSPVVTVTATPTPVAKPADYTARILNGTLVEGEAGKLAAQIKDKGFEIKETKNATSSGFVTTKLRVIAGVPEKIITMIKTILEENYQAVAVEPLVDDKVKIEVIIGKKK